MSLQVEGITFAYSTSVEALSSVSFRASTGVTALLGVNGSGKTTLLSICAGLTPPQRGRVLIGGEPLYSARDRRSALQSVALMPQLTTFPSALTPRDVVCYLGWLKGMTGRDADKRAKDCLASVGLEQVMDKRCGSLSGGMQRRVALAQALVSEPDVILLDEPSTGLDPAQRRAMVELIRALPCTVLFSSHIVEDVADLAAHIIVLHEGRVVYDGSKEDLTTGLENLGQRSAIEAGFFRLIGQEKL